MVKLFSHGLTSDHKLTEKINKIVFALLLPSQVSVYLPNVFGYIIMNIFLML